MKKYGRYIQVFAICAEGKRAFCHADFYAKKFNLLIRKWGLEKIESADDLKNAEYGAILALEGADALYGSLSALGHFYDRGVRLLTLTWNNNNAVAAGIGAKDDYGLTPFGEKVVKECENRGIMIDLSHISDKGFYDVMEIIKKPFVCSHSLSRSVYKDAKRNITDEQFGAVMKHNGVCGMNFYKEFLGGKGDVDTIFSHIEHFCALGGAKNIGIGSDFDGIPDMPPDCNGAKYMEKIAEKLLVHNYRECDVKAILCGNFERVFSAVLK